MPGFDRTGPLGEGPRTGRALGKCGKAKGTPRSDSRRDSGVRLDASAPAGRIARRGGGRGRGGPQGAGFGIRRGRKRGLLQRP